MADQKTPREILDSFIVSTSKRDPIPPSARYEAYLALAQMRDPADEPLAWTSPDPKAVRRRG